MATSDDDGVEEDSLVKMRDEGSLTSEEFEAAATLLGLEDTRDSGGLVLCVSWAEIEAGLSAESAVAPPAPTGVGGARLGHIPNFLAWLEQARADANLDRPLRYCTRCRPSHRPAFRLPDLLDRGARLAPKDFAVGFRVEHPQELVNRAQYGATPAPAPRAARRTAGEEAMCCTPKHMWRFC